jgi:4a-hydroxytetrahydrobiopterin dehydratase
MVNDWVRLELVAALDQHKDIIPILVGHKIVPPPKKALPKEMRGLFKHEYIRLRPGVETWNQDMNHVGSQLIKWGLKDNEAGPDVLPAPLPWKRDLPGLKESRLNRDLADLPGWEPWQDTLQREYPHSRQELRKNFIFNSFGEAIEFMAYLAPTFTQNNHHPRWGNEWKTVQIRLTTWDGRNVITKEDVRVAKEVDKAHQEFRTRRNSP